LSHFKGKVYIERGIINITKVDGGVRITDSRGEMHTFDKVIVAAHSDDAIAMLDEQFQGEKKLLMYKTTQHGTDLFENEDLEDEILTWLGDTI